MANIVNDFLNLPNYKKNFISFTFDGRQIEEFGLIAVFSGDRFNARMTPNFESEVTRIAGRDGQFYWGTTLSPVEVGFSLATDGMTTRQFNAFHEHFSPGKVAKLSLSESPYREAYARLASPSLGSFIPYGEDTTFTQGGIQYTTKATIYRGTVALVFVLDYPLWTSSVSYFDLNTQNDPEVLKAVFEDNLPTIQSLSEIADVDMVFLSQKNLYNTVTKDVSVGADIVFDTASSYGIYNAGTMLTPSQISFTITPEFNAQGYIIAPLNSESGSARPYNRIQITNSNGKISEFRFSIPSLWYTINEAQKIVDSYLPNSNIIDIEAELRDSLNHPIVRAWAIAMVRIVSADANYSIDGAITAAGITYLKENIIKVIFPETGDIPYSATFNIDAKMNITTINTMYTKMVNAPVYGTTLTENANDMIKSSYLYLPGNYNESPGSTTYSTITTDLNLQNFSIDYEYSYS